ncbi:membrane protein [Microbacterium phage Mabodamaca]|uniref:Membrane protein n=1 Tax=Microbacterium phage Mabodamaca TaxID=3078574 RepID=A0AA96SDU2_9CAUD|nr:membrane protein [Microbacterium phage Mabodamaca]
MSTPSTGPAVITLREVYDLVVEVKDSVAVVPAQGDMLKDHEARIRSLERKVWLAAGGAMVLGGALGNLASTLIK